MDAINSKRSDSKKIAELEKELERWKPKPPRSEVVNGENINLQYPKTQKPDLQSQNQDSVKRIKPR